MARIPNDEIERLKREISITRLVEARGIQLKKHGAELVGLCVFHDDREPSLVVSPEKNLWHCLGACQVGGSVIDWVMRAEGVSFRHAVELLRGHAPSLAASPGSTSERTAKKSTVKKLEAPIPRSASDAELLRSVVGFYHQALKESPEAMAYLARRGLQNAEMIDHFQLGFANRTLGYRLPDKNRKEGAELRGALQRVGVIRESGHEHLNGSITIPLFDEHRRVVGMYGRKITEGLRAGTALHLYLPGPHRGVFNVEAFGASKEMILCEALIDALTFWCAGYRNVTSAYGVEGFTEEHREALRRHGTRRVYLAFDRDEAGDRAAAKLAVELQAMGIECYRVLFPKGMDANEYALKLGPAEKSLGLALRQAEWMGKGAAPAASALVASPVATPSEAERDETDEDVRDAGPEDERVADAVPEAHPSLAASPPPPPRAADESSGAPVVEQKDDEIVMKLGDRRWRVRGLSKNVSLAVMRVNVLVSRDGAGFHVDTIELYSARHRGVFIAEAAREVGLEERVIKRDLGEVLLRLEELQAERTKPSADATGTKRVELTPAERAAALELLRAPDLLDRIVRDLDACGVVGERTNKLVGYLAATSRKLERPLAVVIQSSSAAGKSSLMDAVLALMPEEERVSYSAMTGQSLFYMGEADLRHKILAIVEEQGAERASYALKLLQSEGQLTIASTGKDPTTGRLVTHEYKVTGPVMIFLTTTAIEIDEELLNRCLVLTVDEGREQTRRIHEEQRAAQTIQGIVARASRERLVKLHQDAQRLIEPLFVANPFAPRLRFLDHQTRTRRDHMKYLTLIRAIALVHQHQRKVQVAEVDGRSIRYVEATKEDVAMANRLAAEVLGRTLDELPPGTRRLLGLLHTMVGDACERAGIERADFRFSRREVREATGWGHTQLKLHLERLVELELVIAHRGRQGQGYLYELAYGGEGEDGTPFLVGLLDASGLDGDARTTTTSRGSEPDLAGTGRAPVGPMSAAGRVVASAKNEPNERGSGARAPLALPGADPRRDVVRIGRSVVATNGAAAR